MLTETQVVRSKSKLLKELQDLPVTKAVIYRNVDRKAWEQIAKEHLGVGMVVIVPQRSTSLQAKFAT
jgi:(2Fe-2S) ferredoxin